MKLVYGLVLLSVCPLAVSATVVYEAPIKEGLPGWKVENYREASAFSVERSGSSEILVVGRSTSVTNGGSAWQLTGEPFAVRPGQRVTVELRARSTFRELRFWNGFRGHYVTAILWQDAQGNRLGLPEGFGIELSEGRWCDTYFGSTVPEGAASACLALGWDAPDFKPDDRFEVARARVHVTDPAPVGSRVSLRDDGMALVGGKPFFPIGIYAVGKCEFNGNSYDTAFRDLKAAGFNMVNRVSAMPVDDNEEFLSAADRQGVFAFVMPGKKLRSKENYVAPAEDDFGEHLVFDQEKGHPCVLAWYLADDTAMHHTPEEVYRRHRIVKAFDPDRLTFQADPVLVGDANCRYAPFVPATDVFLPEIYPVYEKEPKGDAVSCVIRDMEAVRAARKASGLTSKAVWPIIQHFDGWTSWQRFPTFAELRAMSWASIVHGANGITWYVYHSASGRGRGVVDAPGKWEEISSVTREISAVKDDLVLRDAAVQPTVGVVEGPQKDHYGFSSVTALLKDGENPLLIAVNATTNAVRATIGVTGFSSVKALGEDRSVSVGASGLADLFEPYAVRLYRLGK